uniref:Small ribosomal subunit protein eS4 n=1 Tax=Ignisphaera aggregans TaxID=334771 RepID=A0A7C2VL91_9CREN
MAKKGGSRHLKRLASPEFWPILRKESKWIVKPSPGPHPLNRSIPLLVLIRDVLRIVENSREAKRLIYDGEITVDGKVRRNYKFPVGIMDVVAIPKSDIYVRIVPYIVKYLWYIDIPREEVSLKLVRIENKVLVKGDKLQLNLNDGRNIVVDRADAARYKTLDSLLIEVPSQRIVEHIPLELNKLAIVIDGRNTGRIGRIVGIQERPGMKRRRFLITLEEPGGHRFNTILDYVMVIGADRPLIKVSDRV